MNSLVNSPEAPVWRGEYWVNDNDGTQYRFSIYDLKETVPAAESVFAFVEERDGRYHPHFIGKAEKLPDAMAANKELAKAQRLNANLLFVHEPVSFDAVACDDAEKRLAKRYRPRLNKMGGNRLKAILSPRSLPFE